MSNVSQLNGVYLTEYTTEDGEVHPIVATHFEPTHARKAFPCFDQPQMKSEWVVFWYILLHGEMCTGYLVKKI